MAKVQERLRAEKLRRQGTSIGAIAEQVGVSKSVVSLWCRDVVLSDRQKATLLAKSIAAGHRGRLIGAQANKNKKLEKVAMFIREGKRETRNLTKREILLIGIGMYWGEGSKKSRLSFINSDKDMVLFMYKWFQTAARVPKDFFMPRIFINAVHRQRKEIIEKYWSELLGLPISQFRKTIFIKRKNKKKYSNHETYFGLLSLGIRKSNDLKYRILGLIEGLKCSTF